MEVLARKWRRVSEDFASLEELYFSRRHARKLTAPPEHLTLLTSPQSIPGDLYNKQVQQHHRLEVDGVAGGSKKHPLEEFSESLSRYSRETKLQVQRLSY